MNTCTATFTMSPLTSGENEGKNMKQTCITGMVCGDSLMKTRLYLYGRVSFFQTLFANPEPLLPWREWGEWGMGGIPDPLKTEASKMPFNSWFEKLVLSRVPLLAEFELFNHVQSSFFVFLGTMFLSENIVKRASLHACLCALPPHLLTFPSKATEITFKTH